MAIANIEIYILYTFTFFVICCPNKLKGDPKLSNSQPSKNALSHGFYSNEVVLAWENQQEFDDLRQALRDEYCPDGFSEEGAVFDLASLHWKKRRLNVGSQLAFHKQPDVGAMADASSDGWLERCCQLSRNGRWRFHS